MRKACNNKPYGPGASASKKSENYRYRLDIWAQVLRWRKEGIIYSDIARNLNVSNARANQLGRAAWRWHERNGIPYDQALQQGNE